MNVTRVLVVDDSLAMRRLITASLNRDAAIEVVGQAANAEEARAVVKALSPDVITLDIEMPAMDGLSFLERIMLLRPTPVIMVSNLTVRGAESTLPALELGAIDCVAKPNRSDPHAFDSLAEKVKVAATARLAKATPTPDAPTNERAGDYLPGDRIVAIGASTGGVETLTTILGSFPVNCPPTVIVQHMPAQFMQSFARRLDRGCAAVVQEAVDGAVLEPGKVFIAPGGRHLEIVECRGALRCALSGADPVKEHRPSVDVLFNSLARCAPLRTIGVILTGMGRDGSAGLLNLRNAGAATIGQDEASCTIYGMPKIAYEIGAVSMQLPLRKIASRILTMAEAG